MAIKPICDKYREELTEPGGLVFSPPKDGPPYTKRIKYHLCARAWREFVVFHEQTLSIAWRPPVDEVAYAQSPPTSVSSASEVDTYYILESEWPLFLEWLNSHELSGH